MIALLPALALASPTVAPTAPMYAGGAVELAVSGAAPGSEVRVFASRGAGSGPCAGPVCLDLLAPAPQIATVIADAAGHATISGTLPSGVPSGPGFLQAVQVAPAVEGPVVPVTVWPRTRVLMIGDSITEGTQSAPEGVPYTTVATALLGPGYDVVVEGCGGSSTFDWSLLGGVTLCNGGWWSPTLYEARAQPNLPADVVTVMLGTNDATGFFEPAPVPEDEYARNLDDIVDNLLADGAGTVLLMSPPPMCTTADAATVARLEAYRLVVGATCALRAQVACGPDVYTLLDADDFAGCDVHPNGQGHQTMGIALATSIMGL